MELADDEPAAITPAVKSPVSEPSPPGRGQVAGDSPWRGEGAPPPSSAPPSAPAAANPFDEPFTTEEILVDPYATFESQLLLTAQQVANRLDRTFAAELARCELRREAQIGAS